MPFLILKIVSGRDTERHGFIMEFITGVAKKDTLEISEILAGDYEGKTIKVNGAVHTIRDMGDVAFVVLRKRL